MIRSLLTVLILALTSLPALAGGHGCQSVRFPAGAYIHAVHGQANPHQSQCYVLDVRPGQQARVRVVYGPVFVSTTHTQGNYHDVQFYTVNGRLHVYVHTDYAGPQPFSIEFTFI